MSKFRRVLNVLTGLFMILCGILVMLMESADGLKLALIFIQFGMTFRGFGAIHYYLTMAKYMVGGRSVLYRGMIYLDMLTNLERIGDHSNNVAGYTLEILSLDKTKKPA